MILYPDILVLLFLQLALSSQCTLASRLPPHRGVSSLSKGSEGTRAPTQRQQSGEISTTVLAFGEPCGVYTLSCARGLRCIPRLGDPSPLQALLKGRGFCSNISTPSPSERPQNTAIVPVTHPTHMEGLEKAPCRKLLNTVLKDLEPLVYQSDRGDIYMPNCDKRGFFRKKQCKSSRGMNRGHCWCVDESGTPTPSRTSPQGHLICDNA
ncbi:insulin-like growth factor-binding protein 6 [Esox lucius]|uniref:Thyroglobulin type-1 domain-containing protein n=1 Tax=Esox lucius TaxID=8010 RepID=A0A3P9AHJ0_ESOLU|nr:insulin-like growth factor-binding protein 6 [Esox lucius]